MAEINYPGLHAWHHDDYELAKRDIFRQVGDISESCVFGRQILCAIYIRPIYNPIRKLHHTPQSQNEDIAQGRALMILQLGPSAFKGDDEYLLDMYGEHGAPKVGDWVWARANMGEQFHLCGEGAEQVTFINPNRPNSDPLDSYPWMGWPCRVLADETLIGRAAKPHHVV